LTLQRGSTGLAFGWAALITGAEWLARRQLKRRSSAWLVAYTGLAILALVAGARVRYSGSRRQRARGVAWPGLVLATVGYPLGRRLFGDRPSVPPPDPLLHELVAIEAVAAAEELTWGAIVEPAFGGWFTAVLFGAKHVLVDGRWRRGPGLFLFWWGLSAERRRNAVRALVAHALLNAIGVIRGHHGRRDQF
jgi:hypothetical protein